MSCARRRLAGSGYVKPDNPELEVQNNCAIAALMAAREAQDAALQAMWTGEEEKKEPQLPPPTYTVPPSDTCFPVDGHFYKVPDTERMVAVEVSLRSLEEARAKEEAAWSAHWTQPAPACETNTAITVTPSASEPLDPGTKIESMPDNTEIPRIEVTELS
jgi:hypothetical protein